MSQKIPHDMVLQAITKDYTYDPDTGVLYRNGQEVYQRSGRYTMCQVSVDHPTYITVRCMLSAHCISWYLTYGEWAVQPIDHIDGNTRNNKLNNLRLATQSQNLANQRKRATSTSSQYKGVYYSKDKSKWRAAIMFEGKRKSLGSYFTEVEAAIAYDAAALELHGEFARLNFPD